MARNAAPAITVVRSRERGFFATTIGRKFIMGLTGLVWAGFVFGHMAGNLLMFVSSDAYNSYGHALTSGNLIYVIEALLLGAILIHIGCAISLILDNKKARPMGYAVSTKGDKAASLASRTMAVSGSLILVFIISHLITFKFGPVYMTSVDGVEMRDLYRLLIEVFAQPTYVGWYVVCLILLGFHLKHGVSSLFQSLGLLNSRSEKTIRCVGFVYGLVVSLGFLAQPLVIFFKG